jgi:hypothetical protein
MGWDYSGQGRGCTVHDVRGGRLERDRVRDSEASPLCVPVVRDQGQAAPSTTCETDGGAGLVLCVTP